MSEEISKMSEEISKMSEEKSKMSEEKSKMSEENSKMSEENSKMSEEAFLKLSPYTQAAFRRRNPGIYPDKLVKDFHCPACGKKLLKKNLPTHLSSNCSDKHGRNRK